jgi:hypothetical protein
LGRKYGRRSWSKEIDVLAGNVIKYELAAGNRLCQGEVVSGLIQIKQNVESIGSDGAISIVESVHPFAIVLTQDCDLEQDARSRFEGGDGKSQLVNVLFCEAIETSTLKGQVPSGKDIWKRIIQNKDERYQCLEALPADLDADAKGFSSLGCDFKRYFTLPVDEVYKRLACGQLQRRARLTTPYKEHLLSRFSFFLSRVPLPENHEVPM